MFQVDRDYIGFATLPEQIHRKSVKKGFDFTLMVVGESGLGKSTLVNSLFLNDLYKDRKIPDVSGKFGLISISYENQFCSIFLFLSKFMVYNSFLSYKITMY